MSRRPTRCPRVLERLPERLRRRLTGGLSAAFLGALLGATAPGARAEIPDRAFDAQLVQLDRFGYNEPDKAAQQLRALLADPAHASHRTHLVYALGRNHVYAGRPDEARRIAAELETRPGGKPLARVLLAELQDRLGQTGRSGEMAQQALDELAPTCPAPQNQAVPPGCDARVALQALRLVARAQGARGEYAFVDTTLRRALALAQALQDHNATGLMMASLALNSQVRDESEAAQQWMAQAWQLAQGDVAAMSRVKMYESMVASRRGDRATQMGTLEEALRLAEQAGARRDVALLQNNLLDAYIHTDQSAKAVKLAQLALPVVQSYRDQTVERTLRHNLAVALVQQRQFEPARREVARVVELAQGDYDPVRRALQLRELGEAYAKVGQWKEALKLYHEERALSAETARRNRESSLQQLRLKYDSEAKQRDLELLRREQTLKDRELDNRELAQYVGVGLAALMGLSLVLIGVMLARVREANRKLKANQSLLRAQSERDPLTDLANRRHFLAVMDRHAKDVFTGALLMIDIDHFKHVNDRYGHAAGDSVIVEVSRRIAQAVRAEDLVVRWGGEEFLVFARNVAPDQLQLLAERILFIVGQEPVRTQAGALRVTCSIGFAHFPLPPAQLALHWEQAVNWADMALYTAKSQGRNRARGIVTVEAGDAQALIQIEADFDAACSSERVQLQTILGPEPPEVPEAAA
ncbi:GGDEF domain-containing protein [Mitsuaria sp. GD03876]|uniref:GGDEF domain-containing protein n=1 Tax=Mitsuaria sp. GD03876 TaxID=2975399 RepID=UPI00244C70AC|nr:GGDEF domain-containing protein [Mitsuaria sp. GD03876]MDH0865540.1 GGDEF domain-containing protein [Mitsuaria sp. GD03876]